MNDCFFQAKVECKKAVVFEQSSGRNFDFTHLCKYLRNCKFVCLLHIHTFITRPDDNVAHKMERDFEHAKSYLLDPFKGILKITLYFLILMKLTL